MLFQAELGWNVHTLFVAFEWRSDSCRRLKFIYLYSEKGKLFKKVDDPQIGICQQSFRRVPLFLKILDCLASAPIAPALLKQLLPRRIGHIGNVRAKIVLNLSDQRRESCPAKRRRITPRFLSHIVLANGRSSRQHLGHVQLEALKCLLETRPGGLITSTSLG